MSKQTNNIVMHGTRGMFGNQVVFKRRGGESYVSAPPQTDPNRVPTNPQQVIRDRFTGSAAYATSVMEDADMKAAYQAKVKGNQSAYNVAFRDAFTPPEVQGAITQGYVGQVGNLIVVQASDDFKVYSVLVSIHNASGELIEEGAAEFSGRGLGWSYMVTQANPAVAGSRITATAVDLPLMPADLRVCRFLYTWMH